jgi:hypothetical protein
MPPAGLNVVKRSGKYVYLNAHWKKTQPSCPGSSDLYWTGKVLSVITPVLHIDSSINMGFSSPTW